VLSAKAPVADLSSVVNKYVGETEKNLSRIFNEAEASKAVLFFDEVDALFGKRSDVNDVHDPSSSRPFCSANFLPELLFLEFFPKVPDFNRKSSISA